MTIAQKTFVSLGAKQCWKNSMAVPQKTFIRSSQVTNYQSVRRRKQQSTEWVFEPQLNPTKVVVKTSLQSNCFFCKTGHVASVLLQHRRTVNSEWHSTICLPKLFGEIRKTNQRRRMIVHHGNESSHTSAQISA